MDQIFKEFGNAISGIFSSELVQLAIRGIGIYIVILWLATAFWAYQDMKGRTANPILPFLAAALIVAFTPLLFIFAAILYRIIRPHERVGEAHERMLAEEAMLAEVERLDHCLGCGRRIEEGWMVCPTCRTRLRRVCPSCGKLVGADWALCAWCGVDFERPAGRPAAGAYVPAGSRQVRGPGRPQPQAQPQLQSYEPAPAAPIVAAAAYGSAQARPQAQPAASSEAPAWPGAAPADPTPMATPMAAPVAGSTSARYAQPAEAAPRPAPAAAAPAARPASSPSPFRSISGDVDADEIGSLVDEPAAAPTSARATSSRSSGGSKPRASTAAPSSSGSATQATPPPASAAEVAEDSAPAPAPISGRRAAQR